MILSGVIAASFTSCAGGETKETKLPYVDVVESGENTSAESESDAAVTYPEKTVDLTGQTDVTFDKLSGIMKAYPNLETLTVGETVLDSKDYVALCAINEKVDVVAKVNFAGSEFDLSLDEFDISGKVINDKSAFESFVAAIPEGKKFVMCDCGFTNEEMGALRENYDGTEFVWRLYLSKWNLRTDDEAFSVMIYAADTYEPLTSEDIKVLGYCTNLYALDLGHQNITDLTPIGEITTLRVLILADNKITDVTPLANLKELQYLELFVNRITDISPLAQCTSLVDLNFGWNRVYDVSSIYSLPNIERLWLPTNNVSYSARESISAAFPEAQIVFEDKDSVSSGWRTHERYFSMREMFNNNKYDENFVR